MKTITKIFNIVKNFNLVREEERKIEQEFDKKGLKQYLEDKYGQNSDISESTHAHV